jgi:hypothetical protein
LVRETASIPTHVSFALDRQTGTQAHTHTAGTRARWRAKSDTISKPHLLGREHALVHNGPGGECARIKFLGPVHLLDDVICDVTLKPVVCTDMHTTQHVDEETKLSKKTKSIQSRLSQKVTHTHIVFAI